MKRALWTTVGFILLLAGAFYAVQSLKSCPKSLYCCARPSVYHELKTTPGQQQSLLSLDQQFVEERNRLCRQLCQGQYDLAKLLRQSEVDQEEVDQKITRAGSIRLAMEKAAAAHILKVKSALTPQQAEKYAESFYRDVCGSIEGMRCGFQVPRE